MKIDSNMVRDYLDLNRDKVSYQKISTEGYGEVMQR